MAVTEAYRQCGAFYFILFYFAARVGRERGREGGECN